VAAQLAASEEGLSCVKLFSQYVECMAWNHRMTDE
jgi:hypothetical protein